MTTHTCEWTEYFQVDKCNLLIGTRWFWRWSIFDTYYCQKCEYNRPHLVDAGWCFTKSSALNKANVGLSKIKARKNKGNIVWLR